MPKWWRLAASFSTLVVVPVAVELLISYIKAEPYNLSRAAQVLAGAMAILSLLLAIRSQSRQLRVALELGSLALGLLVTTAASLTLIIDLPGISLALKITTVVLGVLVSAVAGFALYADRKGLELRFATTPPASAVATEVTNTNGLRVIVTKYADFQTSDEEVAQLCRKQVRTEDVHFIGYYVNGACRFHVDSLDNDQLNRFFRGSERSKRRMEYERAGRKLLWIVDRLHIYTSQLDGGILIRTVFDIEQGGLFCYWIDNGVHLVGVSIIQSAVLDADEKLRHLANQIGYLPRGARSSPFIKQEVMSGTERVN